jgi:hypothetical protein
MKREGKTWFVPIAGKLERKNHVWLYDVAADVNIDFTAHQFPIAKARLLTCKWQILVSSPSEAVALGYITDENAFEYGRSIVQESLPNYEKKREEKEYCVIL